MFIDEDFMLQTKTGKHLFHDYAENLPIIDYHSHLEPDLIAEEYRYTSITELWFGGDHYKWRAMRANGIPEEKITGNASDKEKFLAWADTIENSLGNPLYHWSHLELKKYFGITDLLTRDSAEEIYEQCNKYLAEHEVTTTNLIKNSNVKFVGTTDDPLSDLKYHQKMKGKYDFIVAPSFRPDPILKITQNFSEYIAKCENVADDSLKTYHDLITFLITRVHFFDTIGCRSADHGFGEFLYEDSDPKEIEAIYQKGLKGEELSRSEIAKWQGKVMTDLGRVYAELGWVMQIHFGAIRNVNTRLFKLAGTDIGCDSTLDQGDVSVHLNGFLDALDKTNELPRTILYNLNSNLNDLVAALCANFQSNNEGIKNKVQLGAGWWFNDQRDGMLKQMESLSNQGLLTNFVGMLTDSRSFISYPRHDYFRRILCEMIGQNVEKGIYPNDEKLLKNMVEKICYYNAQEFFGLEK